MTTAVTMSPASGIPARAHLGLSARLRQLRAAAIITVTWPVGLALFVVWSVTAALAPLTIVLPALIPLTSATQWYAGLHRRWAARVLGLPDRSGAVTLALQGRTLTSRLRAIVTSRSTWRTVAWLPVHSTVGFGLAVSEVLLFAAIVFYGVYPLLYAVTPHEVFGYVFGIVEIHSFAASWIVMTLAVLAGALWWWAGPSLHHANARLTHAMLRRTESGTVGWDRQV